MIEISHRISATVVLTRSATLSVGELTALISWLLRQSDVQVHALDLCLSDTAIEYTTDQGRLTIKLDESGDGTRQITLESNTLRRGSRETGRQLCYQIARRLIARTEVASIYWQPTRQRMAPSGFAWHQLADAPQRLAS